MALQGLAGGSWGGFMEEPVLGKIYLKGGKGDGKKKRVLEDGFGDDACLLDLINANGLGRACCHQELDLEPSGSDRSLAHLEHGPGEIGDPG